MSKISESFTATGSSGPITGRQVNVAIGGTFVADWEIKKKVGDRDYTLLSGSSALDPQIVDNGEEDAPVWVEITGYTSGTVQVDVSS